MAKQIAKRKFTRRIGPFDLFWRDATSDPHCAVADVFKIVQERLDGSDFQGLYPLGRLGNDGQRAGCLSDHYTAFAVLHRYLRFNE